MYLTTEKDYGDFEFHVDWKMVSPNGDSGVYLRGFPQVQVWDPDNPREVKNGAPRGSGALWNNNPDNPGRWPLVKADNPVGQWNTFRIRMIGNRVSVWLNDKQTVDNQVMDNYFNRAEPVLPKGPDLTADARIGSAVSKRLRQGHGHEIGSRPELPRTFISLRHRSKRPLDVVEHRDRRADAGLQELLADFRRRSAGVTPCARLRGAIDGSRIRKEERGVDRAGVDGELREWRELGVRERPCPPGAD